jgi:predicted anti-sigma-YlaC factor YlaD
VSAATPCPRPEDLYIYLEGELGPYEAAKLEEHLECCEACRGALAERRLLHEAFTTLPPFEVPADFARSVMERLPEPETRPLAWLAPLLASLAALSVGLAGFYLFTGLSAFDMLVGLNGFLGQIAGHILPAAVKLVKTAAVILKVAGDILVAGLTGLTTLIRLLGPQGLLIVIGTAALLVGLAIAGARRFLNQGE